MKPSDIPYGVAGTVCDTSVVVMKRSMPHLGSWATYLVYISTALIVFLLSALTSPSSGQGTDVCPVHAVL